MRRRTPAAPSLEINACADMSGFQDSEITLSVIGTASTMRKGLLITDIGTIGSGAPLVITIDSDEAVPTLSFSPTDVTIDEGGSTETVLIAEGKHGSEVGMVKLSVEGDAMVGLYQGMDKLEEMGGHVYVDLGTSNSARLTARSYSDPDLMDGDTAFKAWKLVEGGDGRRQRRRRLLVQGRRHRLHRRSCSPAAGSAASGSVPDGRRRAVVSAAPGIAASS